MDRGRTHECCGYNVATAAAGKEGEQTGGGGGGGGEARTWASGIAFHSLSCHVAGDVAPWTGLGGALALARWGSGGKGRASYCSPLVWLPWKDKRQLQAPKGRALEAGDLGEGPGCPSHSPVNTNTLAGLC